MNNQSYEEYIRSILGYPSNDIYVQNQYENTFPYNNVNYINNENNLRMCYPKIYKIINPMIQKICNENTENITEERIEEMANEIYFNVEQNNEINININLGNTVKENKSNEANLKNEIKNNRDYIKKEKIHNNPLMYDLIKILLINELLRKDSKKPPVQKMPFPGMMPYVHNQNMNYPYMNYNNNLYEY